MSRRHRLLYGLTFGIALLMTGFFTARAVYHFTDLRSGVGEHIRPWMSIPHIAHAYRVPPQLLFETLQIPPEYGKSRPIGEIARSQNRPVDQVINELRQAIEHYRRRPPPPEPTVTPVPPLSNT